MKKEELMIGDWVRIKKNAKEEDCDLGTCKPGEFVQVHEIIDCCINPGWIGCEIIGGLNYNIIEPIPINDDILSLNGWQREGGLSFRTFGEYYVSILHWNQKRKEIIIDKKGELHPILKLDILHVHKLQHDLSIAGIDYNFKTKED